MQETERHNAATTPVTFGSVATLWSFIGICAFIQLNPTNRSSDRVSAGVNKSNLRLFKIIWTKFKTFLHPNLLPKCLAMLFKIQSTSAFNVRVEPKMVWMSIDCVIDGRGGADFGSSRTGWTRTGNCWQQRTEVCDSVTSLETFRSLTGVFLILTPGLTVNLTNKFPQNQTKQRRQNEMNVQI